MSSFNFPLPSVSTEDVFVIERERRDEPGKWEYWSAAEEEVEAVKKRDLWATSFPSHKFRVVKALKTVTTTITNIEVL